MRFKRSILALGLCFALSEFLFSSKTQASDGQAAQSQVVDLELILAVDTSSSVSQEEFDLQMRGFAEAFRHPAVIAAVRAAGSKGVAISMDLSLELRGETFPPSQETAGTGFLRPTIRYALLSCYLHCPSL